MSRIIITSTDEMTGETLTGWFDPTKAEAWEEAREWDGNNHVGVISRSQWVDETLYRTAGGRWVRRTDATRYHNGPDRYRFISAEDAHDWLIRSEANGADEALTRWFGPVEDERGPGRPPIGEQVKIAFPADMLVAIDAAAEAAGISRAEWVRRACAAALP